MLWSRLCFCNKPYCAHFFCNKAKCGCYSMSMYLILFFYHQLYKVGRTRSTQSYWPLVFSSNYSSMTANMNDQLRRPAEMLINNKMENVKVGPDQTQGIRNPSYVWKQTALFVVTETQQCTSKYISFVFMFFSSFCAAFKKPKQSIKAASEQD